MEEIFLQTEQGLTGHSFFVVHGGTIMAVMEAFSGGKKSYYDWQSWERGRRFGKNGCVRWTDPQRADH